MYLDSIGQPGWPYEAFYTAYPEFRGYSPAGVLLVIWEVLKNKMLREEIEEELGEVMRRVGLTREWWFEQIKSIAEGTQHKARLDALVLIAPLLGIGLRDVKKDSFDEFMRGLPTVPTAEVIRTLHRMREEEIKKLQEAQIEREKVLQAEVVEPSTVEDVLDVAAEIREAERG